MMPEAFDFDFSQSNGATSTTAFTTEQGIFQVVITVHYQTSITTITLPLYDPKKPEKGTKQARESFLKLLTGLNNDTNPLNLRTEYERNSTVLDKFYRYAPGWTTLSWGRKPHVTLPPAVIVRMALEAAECVPYFKSPVHINLIKLGADKKPITTRVTREEIDMLAIPIKPIPALYELEATRPSAPVADPSLLSAVVQKAQNLETKLDGLNQVAQKAKELETRVNEIQQYTDRTIVCEAKADKLAERVSELSEKITETASALDSLNDKMKTLDDTQRAIDTLNDTIGMLLTPQPTADAAPSNEASTPTAARDKRAAANPPAGASTTKTARNRRARVVLEADLHE